MMPVTCKRCAGNGEIVVDWTRYLHPLSGDAGDEAVMDCPDCDGRGVTDEAGVDDLAAQAEGE